MNETGTLETRTIRSVLRRGIEPLNKAGIESARLDAEALLCHASGFDRAALYTRLDETCSARIEALFESFLERRVKHEPVSYITGVKEFWSLDFGVDRRVLIPRPETELLVETTLKYAMQLERKNLNILDLGTGSGALAVALATELPEARLWAVDISLDALAVASANARRHGVAQKIEFLAGDLFESLARVRPKFDLIISNPPYIEDAALSDLAPEIRLHEPRKALDGGSDGLEFYKRIIGRGWQYLAKDGAILFEIGAEQASAVAQLFARTERFSPAETYQDLAGRDRVVAATMKGRLDG